VEHAKRCREYNGQGRTCRCSPSKLHGTQLSSDGLLTSQFKVIFGGYTANGRFVNDMARFDLCALAKLKTFTLIIVHSTATNTWETIFAENSPSPRYSLGPVVPQGDSSGFLIFDGKPSSFCLPKTHPDPQDMRTRSPNVPPSSMRYGVGRLDEMCTLALRSSIPRNLVL